MNEWWMNDKWMMNEWWMNDEWMMNKWWMNDEWMMNEWWMNKWGMNDEWMINQHVMNWRTRRKTNKQINTQTKCVLPAVWVDIENSLYSELGYEYKILTYMKVLCCGISSGRNTAKIVWIFVGRIRFVLHLHSNLLPMNTDIKIYFVRTVVTYLRTYDNSGGR